MKAYLPTPAQIKAECAEIQATWSHYEERRRRGARPLAWTPPETRVTEKRD